MAYVDTMYCPQIARDCIEEEHEQRNNLKICHKFREGYQKCEGAEEHRQFCIDKYEYPNQKGAHPAWNATWYEAQATCKSKSKRLCWQSEWTAACEGSTHRPFPYGYKRDHRKCNMDNPWIGLRRTTEVNGKYQFAARDPEVRFLELSRLDRSVPSGSLEDCKSDFEVYDQPGNFDEWAISDEKPREKSGFAALKGGAWGHVRNQCRPTSFSHAPDELYYFWSFRCCSDAEGVPPWTPSPDAQNQKAPEVEPFDFFPDAIVPKNPPGPTELRYNYKLDDYTAD
jgi:formylglycine-generating enzyme